MTGITGYGAYIPNYRLKVEDIWEVWGDPVDTAEMIRQRRGLTEKAVGRWDEDSVTMAIYAAKSGMAMAGLSGEDLHALYFGSCTNPYTSKAAVPIIAEALAFIRAQGAESIRVSDIVEHVCVSRSTLETRFKSTLGRTVHREIQQVRLDTAKRLLMAGSLSLEAVAKKSGFSSLYYMSAVFQRELGCPPGRFRRQSGARRR